MIYPPSIIGKRFVQLHAQNPIRIEHVHKKESYAMHGHEFSEICIIWEGEGTHVSEFGREPLRAGSVLLLHPGATHGYADVHDLRVTNVYFLDHWFLNANVMQAQFRRTLALFFQHSLREDRRKIYHWTLKPDTLEACRREIASMESSFSNKPLADIWIRSSFIKFLCLLWDGYQETVVPRLPQIPDTLWTVIDKVENLIEQGATLSVEELAHEQNMSADHLSRLCKKYTGRTLSAFYHHRRIQLACQQLMLTDATITNVAYAAGFCDASHFGRAFKKELHVTPLQYRKQYRTPVSE